jgi:formylglycine-generating enzyme required for sulfatase activity
MKKLALLLALAFCALAQNRLARVAVPAAPSRQPRETKLNPTDGLTYVWIPPGSFLMGCSPGDNECFDDEKPAHRLTIAKGFWMGQTPVTQAAYQRIRNSHPSHFEGLNRPVEDLSWSNASRYCSATGGRLPTEAEWEYAARAGTTGPRYGDLDEIAWYTGNSGGETHDVGLKRPNPWGLHDMLGNIWQYVAGQGRYSGAAQSDPPGQFMYGVRGGYWGGDPRFVRVSYRGVGDGELRNGLVGFRCVGE